MLFRTLIFLENAFRTNFINIRSTFENLKEIENCLRFFFFFLMSKFQTSQKFMRNPELPDKKMKVRQICTWFIWWQVEAKNVLTTVNKSHSWKLISKNKVRHSRLLHLQVWRVPKLQVSRGLNYLYKKRISCKTFFLKF